MFKSRHIWNFWHQLLGKPLWNDEGRCVDRVCVTDTVLFSTQRQMCGLRQKIVSTGIVTSRSDSSEFHWLTFRHWTSLLAWFYTEIGMEQIRSVYLLTLLKTHCVFYIYWYYSPPATIFKTFCI
jgi:hypothetical protein